jgi:hypothetical protein
MIIGLNLSVLNILSHLLELYLIFYIIVNLLFLNNMIHFLINVI